MTHETPRREPRSTAPAHIFVFGTQKATGVHTRGLECAPSTMKSSHQTGQLNPVAVPHGPPFHRETQPASREKVGFDLLRAHSPDDLARGRPYRVELIGPPFQGLQLPMASWVVSGALTSANHCRTVPAD